MTLGEYKPISCDFHSLFEHYSTLKKEVTIVLRDGVEIKGVITDVFTQKKEEFITMNEQNIRQDLVYSIEGKMNESSC